MSAFPLFSMHISIKNRVQSSYLVSFHLFKNFHIDVSDVAQLVKTLMLKASHSTLTFNFNFKSSKAPNGLKMLASTHSNIKTKKIKKIMSKDNKRKKVPKIVFISIISVMVILD